MNTAAVRAPSASRRIALPVLAAGSAVVFLVAVNVYRAAAQSITFDEANTYNQFLSGSIARVFRDFSVNNHVLQSLLSRLSVQWFGLSEFTLRLPTVLFSVLYVVAAWRIAAYLLGPGWRAVVALLALGLNPFLLDYFSAARGYGPGLALLLWAAYEVLRWNDDRNERRLHRAGVGAGLAVAANLIFSAPAAGLAVCVGALLAAGRDAQRFWTWVDRFAGPALVAAFVFLAVPLTSLHASEFYYGSPVFSDFEVNLLSLSLYHGGPAAALDGERAMLVTLRIAQALSLAAAAVWVRAALRWFRRAGLDRPDVLLLLCGAMLAAGLAVAALTHQLLGFPYPVGRTVIYWPPLLALALAALVAKYWAAAWPARLLSVVPLAALCVAVALFAAGFTTGHYSEWKYDRSTRRIVNIIRQRHTGDTPATILSSWSHEPSINFYRRRYRLSWLAPTVRPPATRRFDYYVLYGDDRDLVRKQNLHPVFEDPGAGVLLAVP